MKCALTLFVVCALLAPAPGARALAQSAPPSGDGEVAVYLQPIPPGAAPITFTITAAAAVDSRGGEVALALDLGTISQAENRFQRLVASGHLPAGDYGGLALTIQKATVKQARGSAPLDVPDRPIRVAVPFLVARGKAVVLWLDMADDASLATSPTFEPSFAGTVARPPMVSRAGFVSNTGSDSVTLFDKQRRQVAAIIPTCGRPAGLALDRQAGRLYVACPRDDEIQVIDVAAAEVVERARVFPGDRPTELALTPDGSTLVAVNPGSSSVTLFDTAPLTRVERVAVDSGPGSVLLDPTGRQAFVFNTQASSISVIDLARRSLTASIATDTAPLRGQFNARGDALFVIHERSAYLTTVDPVRLTSRRNRVRIGVEAIKADPRRNLLYLGGSSDQSIESYDPSTLLPIDSLKTRGGVTHFAIDVEDNTLYMVSPDVRRVLVGSLADRRIIAEIDVGKAPYWVAVMGER